MEWILIIAFILIIAAADIAIATAIHPIYPELCSNVCKDKNMIFDHIRHVDEPWPKGGYFCGCR